MYDLAESDGRSCPICGATANDFLAPQERHQRFARLDSFSHIVARLQWDPTAIDLAPDARSWPGLPDTRRRRLTTLLAGFCVAEEAVAEHLNPFTGATNDTLAAWVFFLQRRDEERHTLLFDRIAAEVLQLPGANPADRRAAARDKVPSGLLELFEGRLPTMAGDLAAGRAGLHDGVGLYHMVLEGIVFAAGQQALLEDLEDGTLPGVREGIGRVDLDERWHIGFGLRCLVEAEPSLDFIHSVLATARDAASAWGDVVPDAIREDVMHRCARRLSVVGLSDEHVAA